MRISIDMMVNSGFTWRIIWEQAGSAFNLFIGYVLSAAVMAHSQRGATENFLHAHGSFSQVYSAPERLFCSDRRHYLIVEHSQCGQSRKVQCWYTDYATCLIMRYIKIYTMASTLHLAFMNCYGLIYWSRMHSRNEFAMYNCKNLSTIKILETMQS